VDAVEDDARAAWSLPLSLHLRSLRREIDGQPAGPVVVVSALAAGRVRPISLLLTSASGVLCAGISEILGEDIGAVLANAECCVANAPLIGI